MTILKNVWRFQCDPNGDADPTVQVFLKKTAVVDGEAFTINDMTPVPMKFSELTGGVNDLINATKISVKKAEMDAAKLEQAAPAQDLKA